MSDDEPPPRASSSRTRGGLTGVEEVPSSSGTAASSMHGEALEWQDDETFVGAAPAVAARPRPSLSCRALLEEHDLELNLALLAGAEGLDRPIEHTRIQKSGLALAGHFHGIVATRVQILGQTEQSYLAGLSPEARERALLGFFGLGLSCVILTGSLGAAHRPIVSCADATSTPLLHAAERSSTTISALHALFDERLAPRRRLHGVLIDVFGVGLLIMGPSGVGKSESALDLVMRGHRLVADDAVECDNRPPGMVFGAPAKLLRHHLEVRGLGILNIKDLYGVTAIRERKRIDVVVRLVDEAARGEELDRLGLEERYCDILGVSLPELVIPVRPGRDMASILEVAARNELLKNAGHHPGRELFGAIDARLSPSSSEPSSSPRSGVEVRLASARDRVFGIPGTRSGTGRPRGPSWSATDESSLPPPVATTRGSRPPEDV